MICYVEIYVIFIYFLSIYPVFIYHYLFFIQGVFKFHLKKRAPSGLNGSDDFQMLKIFQHFLDEEKILFEFKSVFRKKVPQFHLIKCAKVLIKDHTEPIAIGL